MKEITSKEQLQADDTNDVSSTFRYFDYPSPYIINFMNCSTEDSPDFPTEIRKERRRLPRNGPGSLWRSVCYGKPPQAAG